MKRLIRILSALAMCIILGIGTASSNEGANTLPSESTWNEIESATTPTSAYDNVPSLRAAPPDGPSIGETPAGESSWAGFVLAGLVYLVFRKKRMKNSPL